MEVTGWHSPSDSRYCVPFIKGGHDTDKRKNYTIYVDQFFSTAIDSKEKTGIKMKEPQNGKALYVLSINYVHILCLCL